MEPGDITRRRAWIAVASVICMLSATIHRAEADDTHFSLPADLGSQPSSGIAERAESAGATIGREHDLVRAYLDEKEKIEPDRVPLLKPRWQSDPEAGHGADPTTMQRVMALSFAVPGVAKGFPFEDRTDNSQGSLSVSGKVALFYRVTSSQSGNVSVQIDVAEAEGGRPIARSAGWPRTWKPSEAAGEDGVADDWHYTGWTAFSFVVPERREVGSYLLILSVGAGDGVDHGLVLWKDIAISEPAPETPVAQTPPKQEQTARPGVPPVPPLPRPRPPVAVAQPPPVTGNPLRGGPVIVGPMPTPFGGLFDEEEWTSQPPTRTAPRPRRSRPRPNATPSAAAPRPEPETEFPWPLPDVLQGPLGVFGFDPRRPSTKSVPRPPRSQPPPVTQQPARPPQLADRPPAAATPRPRPSPRRRRCPWHHRAEVSSSRDTIPTACANSGARWRGTTATKTRSGVSSSRRTPPRYCATSGCSRRAAKPGSAKACAPVPGAWWPCSTTPRCCPPTAWVGQDAVRQNVAQSQPRQKTGDGYDVH